MLDFFKLPITLANKTFYKKRFTLLQLFGMSKAIGNTQKLHLSLNAIFKTKMVI